MDAIKVCKGRRRVAPPILDLRLCGDEWSIQALAAIPPVKLPTVPIEEGTAWAP